MRRLLFAFGPALGLVLVTALFLLLRLQHAGWDFAAQDFWTEVNLRTIAAQSTGVALGAMGMTFVVVGGGIDLAMGSVVALVSVAVALLLRVGVPAWLVLPAALALGAISGLGNALLITRLRVVPFLVTLGTMGMARGLAKWLAAEQTVGADPDWLPRLVAKFPEPAWLLLAPAVWLVLLLALALHALLRNTVFGVHVQALGSNEGNARLCGVRVDAVKFGMYALAGTLAGLCGVVHFARNRVGDPTAAVGFELQVIAAVVIGGGSLAGGEGSIVGALFGALMMAVLENGCTLQGMPAYVQEILVGAIIVAAVALDRLRSR